MVQEAEIEYVPFIDINLISSILSYLLHMNTVFYQLVPIQILSKVIHIRYRGVYR